jgi:hypothetical protein
MTNGAAKQVETPDGRDSWRWCRLLAPIVRERTSLGRRLMPRSTDHHPAFHVGIQVMNGPPTVIAKWR